MPAPRDCAASTPPALVLFAWLVVGVPAAWGVEQTVKKALPLFRNAPAPAAKAPATTAPSLPPPAAPTVAPPTSTAPTTEPG